MTKAQIGMLFGAVRSGPTRFEAKPPLNKQFGDKQFHYRGHFHCIELDYYTYLWRALMQVKSTDSERCHYWHLVWVYIIRLCHIGSTTACSPLSNTRIMCETRLQFCRFTSTCTLDNANHLIHFLDIRLHTRGFIM